VDIPAKFCVLEKYKNSISLWNKTRSDVTLLVCLKNSHFKILPEIVVDYLRSCSTLKKYPLVPTLEFTFFDVGVQRLLHFIFASDGGHSRCAFSPKHSVDFLLGHLQPPVFVGFVLVGAVVGGSAVRLAIPEIECGDET
jgi:hypothetical protein